MRYDRDWLRVLSVLILGVVVFGLGVFYYRDLAPAWAVAIIGAGSSLVAVGSRLLIVRIVVRYGRIRIPDWVTLLAVLAIGAVLYAVFRL